MTSACRDRVSEYSVGIEDHYAWANLVSVGAVGPDDQLLDRRRVELLDRPLPASPYHAETIGMPTLEAETLIRNVRTSAASGAKAALSSLIADLAPAICRAIAIRTPPLTRLPDTVAAVHANAQSRNRADGMIYHQALTDAAVELGIEVCYFDKATVLAIAAAARGITDRALEDRIKQLGRLYGPPWRKGHVVAYAGALLAHVSAAASTLELPAP